MGLKLLLVSASRLTPTKTHNCLNHAMSWGRSVRLPPTLVAESRRMLVMEPVSPSIKVPVRIKVNYLEPALLRIPGPELLINVVRRRVRQLVQGHRPLTQTDARMDFSDIALKEISEGRLTYEIADEAEAAPDTSLHHDGVTPASF